MRHLLSCVLWKCELCGTWRVLERRCKPCVAKLATAMRERFERFMAELSHEVTPPGWTMKMPASQGVGQYIHLHWPRKPGAN